MAIPGARTRKMRQIARANWDFDGIRREEIEFLVLAPEQLTSDGTVAERAAVESSR